MFEGKLVDRLQFSSQPPSRPPGSSELGPGCCLRFFDALGKGRGSLTSYSLSKLIFIPY